MRQSSRARVNNLLGGSRFAVTAAIVLGMAVTGAAWWQGGELPRRFGSVESGRLYRSGNVTPRQLENLQREYGITRVISLLNPDTPESRDERRTAERLGLEWDNVPLGGDGSSSPEDRDRLRVLLTRDKAGPTLVHCAAGVNRTGLAVGMYRLHRQGWSHAQVMAELRGTDFEDLPKHQNLRDALIEEAHLAAKCRAGAGGAQRLD